MIYEQLVQLKPDVCAADVAQFNKPTAVRMEEELLKARLLTAANFNRITKDVASKMRWRAAWQQRWGEL